MRQECNIDKIIQILSNLQSELNEQNPPKKGTVESNEQQGETQSEEKKSCWVRVREKLRKIYMLKKEPANQASESGGSQGGRNRRNINQDQKDANLEIQKLQSDILQMKTAFENLTLFQTEMSKSLELEFPSNKLKALMSSSHDLKDVRRKIVNLKSQIPSLLLKHSSRALSITDSQTAEENSKINENGTDIYLPGLHVSKDFRNSSAFEEVVKKFEGLGFTQKQCLLSFAVFPENREVKRTMLMYWWIGEGFLISENSVTRILDEFSTKGLLEEVEDERKLKPNTYRMEPHVHSVVVYLAKFMDLYYLYNWKGELILKKSPKEKVCLVRGSSLLPEAKTSVMQPKNLKTIFNSSERYPDFTFKWLMLMDSLKVLYLGRWERIAKRHIEVESIEFLKNMKALKNLRLASFQGISRIEKLDDSICELPKLVILDLRACYNLEGLPSDIGLLDNLIYLDLSECFMLDRMPKGIAQLSKLQVLKGFVISESDDERNCAVKHLESLRKLSITVNKYLFKVEKLMESLKGLKQLQSLKIAWGARFPENDQRGETSEGTNEAEQNIEPTNEEKENQRDHATEKKQKDLKEQEDEQVQKLGQTNVERKGDVEETAMQEAQKSNSEKVVEGEKKASPLRESSETVEKKPDDKSKVENEGDGDKSKSDPGEGKKHDEAKARSLESDNAVEGVKKEIPSPESTNGIQNIPNDHQRGKEQEEKGDGETEKLNLEERKKEDEAKADKVEKKSPLQESKDTIQSKPDDQKVQEKVDGKRSEDDVKKLDEGEAKTQKSVKTAKFGKKVSFSENSMALIEKKPNELKRDNATAKEIHETPSSPSRPPKESRSNKAKLFKAMGNETKKWRKPYQQVTTVDKLPSSLKKLELECFPGKNPPSWLNPKNLDNLEKLYIKGGNLSGFSDKIPPAENKWGVEILRLKYLHEFKAEWKHLQALFPKMKLLEKYKCPKVAFCPTDGNGVWRS